MRYTFLDKKDDKVFFVGGKLEIFIPKVYFEEEIAEEAGMKISTLGIFVMKYFKDPDSNTCERYQFELPESITFSFSESEDVKGVILKGLDEDSYKKYTLYNGDIFIDNINLPMTYKNTERLVKLHHGGKIPNTIRYGSIINLYLENMLSNDCNLKVPAAVLEISIGELARESRTNLDTPFRKAITTKNISEYSYYQVSIGNLAMLNSTFTAITSEDMNQAVVTSISKARTNGQELETPMEKTIKY